MSTLRCSLVFVFLVAISTSLSWNPQVHRRREFFFKLTGENPANAELKDLWGVGSRKKEGTVPIYPEFHDFGLVEEDCCVNHYYFDGIDKDPYFWRMDSPAVHDDDDAVEMDMQPQEEVGDCAGDAFFDGISKNFYCWVSLLKCIYVREKK
jgi:hypothetical protein